MSSSTYDASIDGIQLEMEHIEDSFRKSIAKYEYPYRNGAELEDMGQEARCVRVRCYFWDNEVQQTYADHIDLLNKLESRDIIEMVHPQYGPMNGCVESVSVNHDDLLRTAVVEISFVEELRKTLQDVSYGRVQASISGSFASLLGGLL
jgi:prophage DNA circulation protein